MVVEFFDECSTCDGVGFVRVDRIIHDLPYIGVRTKKGRLHWHVSTQDAHERIPTDPRART